MKYLVSFRTTLKVSRYLFRALALLLWLLVALISVFYIVNALNQKEAEIRRGVQYQLRSGPALHSANVGCNEGAEIHC